MNWKKFLACVVIGLTLGWACVSVHGAMTQSITGEPTAYWWTSNIYEDDAWTWAKEVETIIEDATLESGYLTLTNGLIIDNETDTALTITEDNGTADEDLVLTFTADTITATSSTGLVALDWGTIVPAANQMLFTPVATPVGTTEGTLYYDSDVDILYVRKTSGWVDCTASAASGSLDAAYNTGSTIDVDTAALTFTVSTTDNNAVMVLAQNDASQATDPNGLEIDMVATSTGTALDIDGQTTGYDIKGTGDAFTVDGSGAVIAASADFTGAAGITLQNDATILNDVDNEIQFMDGAEDVSFGFGTSDTLTLTSDSSVGTIAFGDLDAFTGVNTIAMDAAASNITLTAAGAGQDLTIALAGTTPNSSLFLTSTGTAADAIRVNASDGGLDLDAADGIAIDVAGAAGEDIILTNAGGSIKIEATEADTAAIVLDASTDAGGGIDIDFGTGNLVIVGNTTGADATLDADKISIDGTDDMNFTITSSTAAEDLTIAQVGANDSSIIVTAAGTAEAAATESDAAIQLNATAGGVGIRSAANATDAIRLETDGGTSDVLILHANQGNAATSIHLLSDIGGITATATDGPIALNATGAADGDYTLTVGDEYILNVEGGIDVDSNEAAADAIVLNAAAGGIDLTAAALMDIDVLASGGRVTVTASEAAASQFHVDAQGAHAGDAIILETTNSGILLLADGAADGDITLDAEGVVSVVTVETAVDQFKVDATGANAGDVINLETTDGGIMINADGTTAGDIELNAVDDIIVTSTGNVTVTAQAANNVGFFLLNSAMIYDGAVTAFTGADVTPDVSGKNFFTSGAADTYTGFDVGSGTPDVGQFVIVLSAHAAVFDTTASGAAYPFVGSSVDITTAAGDITMWLFDGTNWVLVQFTDISADNSGGT